MKESNEPDNNKIKEEILSADSKNNIKEQNIEGNKKDPTKENYYSTALKNIIVLIKKQNSVLVDIKDNSYNSYSWSFDTNNVCAKETNLNTFKDELKAKIDSVNEAIKTTNSNVKKIHDNEVIVKPNLTFIIVWCIGGFLLIAVFLALFVTSKNSFDKLALERKQVTTEQKTSSDDNNNTLALKTTDISNILRQELTNSTLNISQSSMKSINESVKEEINEKFKLLPKKDEDTETNKYIKSIKDDLQLLKTNTAEISSLQNLKIKNEKEIAVLNSNFEKNKKELDNLKNSLKINKSLLIVFTASNDLLFTDELAKQMNELFNNEDQSRDKGFYRAFSLLVESNLLQFVEFNKTFKTGTIKKDIANKNPVDINSGSILKKINDLSLESKKNDKEILVISSDQNSSPIIDNPETHVFKDTSQVVNFVFFVKKGSNIAKSKYENWGKWASRNNATITWLYEEENDTAKKQIIEIIKKAMGKDMGF